MAAAWLSILALLHLPWRPPIQGLRRAGGLALGMVALMVWGAPVPPWLPAIVLVLGVLWSSRHSSSGSSDA